MAAQKLYRGEGDPTAAAMAEEAGTMLSMAILHRHKPRGDGVPAAWQRLCKGCTRLALRRVNIYQLAGYNNFRLWHMAQPECKQGSLSGNS